MSGGDSAESGERVGAGLSGGSLDRIRHRFKAGEFAKTTDFSRQIEDANQLLEDNAEERNRFGLKKKQSIRAKLGIWPV